MFQNLSNKLQSVFEGLSNKGVLSEDDVSEVLREIRLALLEADVNLDVVKELVEDIKSQAVGQKVHEALNPAQQIVKIVNTELGNALGGDTYEVTYSSAPPTVVLMAGLQGAGKTTTSAKLAKWFKSQGRNPLMVGADLQRPAAVEQLRTLGSQIDVPVFSEPTDPVQVAASAIEEAKNTGKDVVIVDTAGRLAIDAELMEQVRQISDTVNPTHTFLVVDAMTGQDAVSVAKAFHETLALSGVILSKLDGDARGGAALSVKKVVGRPIAFAATGEKLEDFDLFHPDRMASRILGMGDVLTLIEKAEQTFEKEEAEAAAQKMLSGEFTLNDFIAQMQQIKKMGPLSNLMALMPGLPKEVKDVEITDNQVARLEAIVYSMTEEERENPDIIDSSRKARIASGSGAEPNQVAALLTQFKQMRKMMKKMGGFGTKALKKSARKGKKGKKGKKGGRVTPKGGRTTPKGTAPNKVEAGAGLTLPGLNSLSTSDIDDIAEKLGIED